MPSPSDIGRRRGYCLAFLVRQASGGIKDVIEDLVFAAVRDKGYTTLQTTVHDDLVYLEAHKLVLHASNPEEITGERQTFWTPTTRGKNVVDGHAERPEGIEL